MVATRRSSRGGSGSAPPPGPADPGVAPLRSSSPAAAFGTQHAAAPAPSGPPRKRQRAEPHNAPPAGTAGAQDSAEPLPLQAAAAGSVAVASSSGAALAGSPATARATRPRAVPSKPPPKKRKTARVRDSSSPEEPDRVQPPTAQQPASATVTTDAVESSTLLTTFPGPSQSTTAQNAATPGTLPSATLPLAGQVPPAARDSTDSPLSSVSSLDTPASPVKADAPGSVTTEPAAAAAALLPPASQTEPIVPASAETEQPLEQPLVSSSRSTQRSVSRPGSSQPSPVVPSEGVSSAKVSPKVVDLPAASPAPALLAAPSPSAAPREPSTSNTTASGTPKPANAAAKAGLKPNAARNPLGKMRSSKITSGAGGGSQSGTPTSGQPRSGGFNILNVLSTTSGTMPAKSKAPNKGSLDSKTPKTVSSPVLSEAEKAAQREQMAQARERARREREEAKSASFDLLAQNDGIKQFEDSFREDIRRQHLEENGKYGGRYPLPRLTTYGSIFSLMPRSTSSSSGK
ncbi:hypothetical protein JCM8202_004535 [Rhodotorula sphaerocarpa]